MSLVDLSDLMNFSGAYRARSARVCVIALMHLNNGAVRTWLDVVVIITSIRVEVDDILSERVDDHRVEVDIDNLDVVDDGLVDDDVVVVDDRRNGRLRDCGCREIYWKRSRFGQEL